MTGPGKNCPAAPQRPAGMTARAWRRRTLAVSLCAAWAIVAWVRPALAADATWNYAVQVSAVVSVAPPQIALSWPEDTWAGKGYAPTCAVRRKLMAATTWDAPVTLGAGVTVFTDTNVQPGVAYEYEVARTFQKPGAPELDHVAYGYVLSGIGVPFPDHRGRVLLVIEDRVANALAGRISTLQADLVGDGWTVSSFTVSASDSPGAIRQRIAAEYASGERVDSVLLLGHVPVVKSGSTWADYAGLGSDPIEQIPVAPDGHSPRALSCDAYYGDIDGTWLDANGDGVFENDSIPTAVEIAVGRVDFTDLPGLGVDDFTLMARYLDKDHAFRRGALRFDRRTLIADRVGLDYKRAPAGGAYRNFSAFYGPQNIVVASAEDTTPDAERWIGFVHSQSFAWAFGSGGGGSGAVAFLGSHGEYHSVDSQDLAGDTHVAYFLLFGSSFLDWSETDNLLRSALASPTGGLGAAWSGRPTLIVHQTGLGEPVGHGVRLTQNNDGSLYFSPPNSFRRSIHIAWLGDPTLRLEYPSPPANLGGSRNGSTVTLAWQASADNAQYVVYRGVTATGPFIRLTPAPISDLHYVDPASPSGTTYLVRAVRLDETASGTYQNPSTGTAWTSPGGDTPPPPSPPPPATGGTGVGLVNLSTRLHLAAGEPAFAGFVVAGNAARRVLLRAAGPALGGFGVSDAVSDPQLELHDAKGATIATNAGWDDDPQVAAAADAVGAFKFAAGSRDAALLVTLPPGNYTAELRASNAGSALLEVYGVGDAAEDGAALANLSTRGSAGSGDGALFAGLSIGGTAPVRVLVRAVGPGLAAFGVGGAIGNPVLTLYRDQQVIARNDDWGVPQPGGTTVLLSTDPAEIAVAAAAVGAFALQPGSHDSAIVATLPPGSYTANVEPASGASGAALVEVYRLPDP